MAAESMFTGNIELVMHTMLNRIKDVKYMEFLFVALGGAAGAVSRYA